MSRRTQEQVAELWRDALGLGDERAITAVHNLGVMRLRAGRMTEAEAHMTEAFEARQRVLGDEHPTTAASLRWLSELRREQGRLREATTLGRQALPVLRSALESRNASLADDAMPIAEARVRLGAALLRTGDTAAGRALLESAAVSFEAAGRVDEPDAVRARRELATVARRSDRIRMHSCPGVGSPWPRTRFFQRRAVTMLASAAGESGWNEARLDSAGIDVGLAREALPSLLGFEEFRWASARGVFQSEEGALRHARFVRDLEMATLFTWLARERHADRRIIIWAATSHLVRGYQGLRRMRSFSSMR